MLLRDWSTSLITPVGNVRPPKASGGRPLCPKDLVDKVRQFVTPCKKKRTNISIIAISKALHGNIPHKGWCIMRKKLETTQASRHRASGGSPSGRPTGVLWLDIAETRGLEEHVIWSDQKWFLLQTSPSSRTKDIKLLWAIDWLWPARNRGRGSRSRRCCLFGIIRPANISGVYVFTEVDQDKITSTT